MLTINDVTIEVDVLIVPTEMQQEEMIVGRSALDQRGIVITKTDDRLEITKVLAVKEEIQQEIATEEDIARVNKISYEEIIVNERVGEDVKEQVYELVNEYRECFAQNMKEVGTSKTERFHIELTDQTPVRYKPYRLPYAKRAIVNEKI